MSDKEFSLAERLNAAIPHHCRFLRPQASQPLRLLRGPQEGPLAVLRKIGRKSVVPRPVARAYVEAVRLRGPRDPGLPEKREAGRRPASNRLQEFAHIGKRWLASEGTAAVGIRR